MRYRPFVRDGDFERALTVSSPLIIASSASWTRQRSSLFSSRTTGQIWDRLGLEARIVHSRKVPSANCRSNWKRPTYAMRWYVGASLVMLQRERGRMRMSVSSSAVD